VIASRTSVGVDLGASTIHVVAVHGDRDAPPSVRDVRTFEAADVDGVVALARGAAAIGIDAPSQLSTANHRDDDSISPKFRVARCGEIALGQEARIWVPWVTPWVATKVPSWMQVGFASWSALRAADHEPLEVYPAGVFRVLAGSVPPRKTTRAGHDARVRLLARYVELPATTETWSHDTIDALAAALVAHQQAVGLARELRHDGPGCDPSGIWLPAAPQPI
jgi:Protein of unknown function (DUF429)